MISKRRKPSCCRGFTLIELMIVTVVVGVVASLAAPSFQRAYDRHSFKAGRQRAMSTLKKARSFAIAKKEPYGVYIDPEAKTLILFENSVNPEASTFDIGDSVISVDTLTSDFQYVYTDVTDGAIVFQPNGSARLTGLGNIYLTGETEGMMADISISILASTGRINAYSHFYAW